MILLDSEPPEYETVFAADLMFFQSAKAALEKARTATKRIVRANMRHFRHMEKLEAARVRMDDLDHRGDRPKGSYDDFESLAISAESIESETTGAYGPLFQQLALVHILSAIALEAHINIRAESRLEGRFWRAFERLNVDAKWLLLPKVLGLPGFDPGAEPFQGFDRLISLRNALVHYKPQREEYHGFDNPDGFAKKLSLSIEAGEWSLHTAEAMVIELAKQLGGDSPWRFGTDSTHFLETHIKERTKRRPRQSR